MGSELVVLPWMWASWWGVQAVHADRLLWVCVTTIHSQNRHGMVMLVAEYSFFILRFF